VNDDLDALRRRLYAPDVTADEVERYRALAGDQAADGEPLPDAGAPQDDGRPARPAPRRRRALLAALATFVVVALAGIGVAATSRPHPGPTPSPSETRSPLPIRSSFDDSIVALPTPVRASFVAALKAGRSAGVLRYFYDHPDQLPAQLRTPGRADSYERFGVNTAIVFLSPSPAAQKGGRLTVAVTLDAAAAVQLRAIRADSGMQSFIERLDDGAVRGIPGLPMVRTVVYDGEAPTVLELTVPKGVRWDVVAVFTD
jgi:hypothetical protein